MDEKSERRVPITRAPSIARLVPVLQAGQVFSWLDWVPAAEAMRRAERQEDRNGR